MNRDRLAGLVILLVCTGLFYEGWRYPADSRLFPLALLAFLMIGATIMIVRPRSSKGEEEGDPPRVVLALSLCVLYVVLVEPLGYFLATALFMAAFMAMMGLRRPIICLAAIAGIDLGLYLLFVWQLKVPVPAGFLFQ